MDRPHGNPYIFSAGEKDFGGRDWATLVAAAQEEGILLRVFSRGQSVACDGGLANCVVMPLVSREEYSKWMEEALCVALPLTADAKWEAGVTLMNEGIRLGKIMVVTDRNTSLADGFITNGSSGFLVDVGD